MVIWISASKGAEVSFPPKRPSFVAGFALTLSLVLFVSLRSAPVFILPSAFCILPFRPIMPDFVPPLPAAWSGLFDAQYPPDQFSALAEFVEGAYRQEVVFPERGNLFRALALVPPDRCRVVIIGQDPYPTPGNAQGLSFSVPVGAKIPGSLATVFSELQRSVTNWTRPKHGDLEAWARQGVLLLNTILSVKDSAPLSHAKRGWEPFTAAVIRHAQRESPFIVFLLWGANAQKVLPLIDTTKHRVLLSSHPSRLAQNSLPAERKFVGNNHFIETNRLLETAGLPPIQW
jgi:uracil-DNA glycosylase